MKRNNKKQVIRLNESTLNNIIKKSIKRVLMESEMENMHPTYQDWSRFLRGRQPIFEFADGIVYVDYDENTGCLCSGGVTNVGFHKDGEVEVEVEDGNFQSALEYVYEELSANHSSYDDDF